MNRLVSLKSKSQRTRAAPHPETHQEQALWALAFCYSILNRLGQTFVFSVPSGEQEIIILPLWTLEAGDLI